MSDLEFALLLSLSDVGTIRVCYRFFASETRGRVCFPFQDAINILISVAN